MRPAFMHLFKFMKSKAINLVITLLVLLLFTSCTFMYVPFIPDNPQARAPRFLLSDSQGLRVEAEQLQLDMTIQEIPESDWLAVQWFSPLSKEVASDSKWLEVIEDSGVAQNVNFELPKDITLTPGYWRAVVSYQGRLIRQFGFDYALVVEEIEEASELNEAENSEALETNSDENTNDSTQKEGN